MRKIIFIIVVLIFGLTTNVCNYLSPQEKCMEDNACRNRAQACFAGFAPVKVLFHIEVSNEEITSRAFLCNTLQSNCELDCYRKHPY